MDTLRVRSNSDLRSLDSCSFSAVRSRKPHRSRIPSFHPSCHDNRSSIDINMAHRVQFPLTAIMEVDESGFSGDALPERNEVSDRESLSCRRTPVGRLSKRKDERFVWNSDSDINIFDETSCSDLSELSTSLDDYTLDSPLFRDHLSPSYRRSLTVGFGRDGSPKSLMLQPFRGSFDESLPPILWSSKKCAGQFAMQSTPYRTRATKDLGHTKLLESHKRLALHAARATRNSQKVLATDKEWPLLFQGTSLRSPQRLRSRVLDPNFDTRGCDLSGVKPKLPLIAMDRKNIHRAEQNAINPSRGARRSAPRLTINNALQRPPFTAFQQLHARTGTIRRDSSSVQQDGKPFMATTNGLQQRSCSSDNFESQRKLICSPRRDYSLKVKAKKLVSQRTSPVLSVSSAPSSPCSGKMVFLRALLLKAFSGHSASVQTAN